MTLQQFYCVVKAGLYEPSASTFHSWYPELLCDRDENKSPRSRRKHYRISTPTSHCRVNTLRHITHTNTCIPPINIAHSKIPITRLQHRNVGFLSVISKINRSLVKSRSQQLPD